VRLAFAVAVLVAAGPAAAQGSTEDTAPFGHRDDQGDGGRADVVAVFAFLTETALVQVRFDAEPGPDVALRGVLMRGEPGAAEPTEWYQFTVANATHAFAAHGTPRDVRVVASSWNGTAVDLEFERSEPASGSCVFAVVESGVFGDGGFEVLDVAPRGFASMESAWPIDACPVAEPIGPQEAGEPAEKGSPGLGLGLLAAVGMALLLRRR
jgi:hypothetical protein